MSTKIYYAYRVPKEQDILKILLNIREIATQEVASNEKLLKSIHSISTMYAKVLTEEEISEHLSYLFGKPRASWYMYEKARGYVDSDWIVFLLKQLESTSNLLSIDITFRSSIFYDKDYWYIKFFPNSRWMYRVLELAEEASLIQDFHYQNQTDPPSDVIHEDYLKRGEKWDELLGEEGNYMSGFDYDVFSPYFFGKLLEKYYYTGEDLYKHLAYKFDLEKE